MTQHTIDRGINWFLPTMDNLRFMRARYIKHSFKPHAHNYYVISIIESGLQTFDYGRQQLITEPGKLILINPGEFHTGEAAIADGFAYRALYPTRNLMQSIMQEFVGNSDRLPVFNDGVKSDSHLHQWIQHIHYHSEQQSSPLAIEEQMIDFLVEVIRRYSTGNHPRRNYKTAHQAVMTCRDYIEANYAHAISLDDLSQLVHISPFHLARLFRKHIGLPPHKYLENVRIHHAEHLLRYDNTIADVAFNTGFSSQSHLTRTFKRVIGTTPGEYVKMSKIV